jgi:hypothetical protein
MFSRRSFLLGMGSRHDLVCKVNQAYCLITAGEGRFTVSQRP